MLNNLLKKSNILLTQINRCFSSKTKTHFDRDVTYAGTSIVGDMNWRDGKLIDGRPLVNYGKPGPCTKPSLWEIGTDFSPMIEDLNKNKKYVTYNSTDRSRYGHDPKYLQPPKKPKKRR